MYYYLFIKKNNFIYLFFEYEKKKRIQPSLRHIIYNTHIQNTYDYSEWESLLLEFQSNSDLIEKQRIIEALTYTRLPSLLSK